jgi:hypothetical protein
LWISSVVAMMCPGAPRGKAGLLVLSTALLVGGCFAESPETSDGGLPPGKGNRPSVATCTNPSGQKVPACPGSSCAQNALGAPDGKTVDLAQCEILDLVFTGGTIINDTKKAPDLAFTLGSSAGSTRIGASADGVSFKVIAFIGKLPAGTDSTCAAELSGGRALVYFERCETIAAASFIQLVRDTTVKGSATVDAVEGLNFQSAN